MYNDRCRLYQAGFPFMCTIKSAKDYGILLNCSTTWTERGQFRSSDAIWLWWRLGIDQRRLCLRFYKFLVSLLTLFISFMLNLTDVHIVVSYIFIFSFSYIVLCLILVFFFNFFSVLCFPRFTPNSAIFTENPQSGKPVGLVYDLCSWVTYIWSPRTLPRVMAAIHDLGQLLVRSRGKEFWQGP